MAAARNRIALVAPANVGDPPDFTLVPNPATVRFSGTAKFFMDATPFLPWINSGLRKSPTADISMHLLEALLLSVCSFNDEAANELFLTTAVAPSFFKTLLGQLVKDGFRLTSFKTFTEFAYSAGSIANNSENPAAYVIAKTDLLNLEAPSAISTPLDWIEAIRWSDWFSSDSVLAQRITSCALISLFGPRGHVSREASVGRFSLMCGQLQASFVKLHDAVALPAVFLGPLIVEWLRSLSWPHEYACLATSDALAFKEMRSVLICASGSQSQKSALLMSYLPRALSVLPGIAAFMEGSTQAADLELLLQLLAQLKLEARHPTWADLRALNEAMLHRIEICSIVSSSNAAPQARLVLLLEDFAAERRSTKLKTPGSGQGTGDGDTLQNLAAVSSDHSLALNELRRSAPLIRLTTDLESLFDDDQLDRSTLFKMVFESQISSVVRFFTGILSSLDLHPIFARLSSLRLSKFKRDATSLAPLGRYFGECVVESVRVVLPSSHHRLDAFTLHHTVVYNLLTGSWHLIDFEQVLVLDVALVRAGQKPRSESRNRALWFVDEALLTDLVAPMTALLVSMGYSNDSSEANSFAAVVTQVIQAFRLSRMNSNCASTLSVRAVTCLHKAIRDSAENWTLYFLDPSPWAPFPESVMPEDSTSFHLLTQAMKTSNMMVDLVADGFDELLEAMISKKRPVSTPSATPTKKAKKGNSAQLSLGGAPAGAAPEGAAPSGAAHKYVPFYLVTEADNKIQLSKSLFNLAKVKAHFGEKCFAVALSNKIRPEEACPCPGTPGHMPGDPLHDISVAQRDLFKAKRTTFSYLDAAGNVQP
jgi:hypothetical protein